VLEHAALHDLPGAYNAAGDGVLALSEVASLLGKPLAPLLPPWGTGITASALRRVGVRIPPEMLQQLRYGRALDNRKLKAAGYAFRATSRETVHAFAEHLRTRGLRDRDGERYQYEREVEEFLRWSPAVRGDDRLGLGRLSRDQLAELARALESLPEARPVRLAPRGTASGTTLRTGSPSASGGAADPEPAADDPEPSDSDLPFELAGDPHEDADAEPTSDPDARTPCPFRRQQHDRVCVSGRGRTGHARRHRHLRLFAWREIEGRRRNRQPVDGRAASASADLDTAAGPDRVVVGREPQPNGDLAGVHDGDLPARAAEQR